MTKTEIESRLEDLKNIRNKYEKVGKDERNYLQVTDLVFKRYENESKFWFYSNGEAKPKYLNIVLTFLTSIDYFILKMQKEIETKSK
jgi:hypothetical protein